MPAKKFLLGQTARNSLKHLGNASVMLHSLRSSPARAEHRLHSVTGHYSLHAMASAVGDGHGLAAEPPVS